jgi:hypothetical protein
MKRRQVSRYLIKIRIIPGIKIINFRILVTINGAKENTENTDLSYFRGNIYTDNTKNIGLRFVVGTFVCEVAVTQSRFFQDSPERQFFYIPPSCHDFPRFKEFFTIGKMAKCMLPVNVTLCIYVIMQLKPVKI